VSKVKSMFERMCSIAVIIFFAYILFFINIRKEIIFLCQKAWISFWLLIKADSVTIMISSVFVILILLIFISLVLEEDEGDNVKKRKKKKKKKEKKEKSKKEIEKIVQE